MLNQGELYPQDGLDRWLARPEINQAGTSRISRAAAYLLMSRFGADRRPPLEYQTPVESDMPLFARALVAFQRGDFFNAVSRFDELAARYPIETSVQDGDAALKSLNQAFLRMDHYMVRTPSTDYQYTDVAERLYRDTTDKRFRDKAVAWAHELQRLQPWTAWAYVIEAELAVATAELAKGNPFTRSRIRKDTTRAIRADAYTANPGDQGPGSSK